MTGGLVGTPDTISSSTTQAISILTPVTLIDASTANYAATIAEGAPGQIKYLTTIAAGNTVQIVNAGGINGTSLIFNAVGEGAILVCDSTTHKWSVIGATATYNP